MGSSRERGLLFFVRRFVCWLVLVGARFFASIVSPSVAAFSENEAIHGLTPSGLKFSEKFSS
jgi:hypothetical protein